jgi:hypothetical protein
VTDAPAPLRYSRKRHNQAWAYTGIVFFSAVGLGGAYATLGLSLELGDSPAIVVVDALLALACLELGGWAAMRCLALTRPWWTLEVRGSVYLDHRTYGRRRCYDLATSCRAWVIPHHDFEYGYRLSLNLTLPEGPAKIVVDDFAGLGAALADALAEHPNPALVWKAITDLRWFAAASPADLARWRDAQRAARRRP